MKLGRYTLFNRSPVHGVNNLTAVDQLIYLFHELLLYMTVSPLIEHKGGPLVLCLLNVSNMCTCHKLGNFELFDNPSEKRLRYIESRVSIFGTGVWVIYFYYIHISF